MKKLVIMFCIVCGMISLLGGCKKKENLHFLNMTRDDMISDQYLLPDAYRNAFFPCKIGSKWILKSTLTGELDSAIVTYFTHRPNRKGIESKSINIKLHNIFKDERQITLRRYSDTSKKWIEISTCTEDGSPQSSVVADFSTNTKVPNEQHIMSSNTFEYYPLFTLQNGKSYANVFLIIISGLDFYFAENVGLIAINTSKGRYELVEYELKGEKPGPWKK